MICVGSDRAERAQIDGRNFSWGLFGSCYEGITSSLAFSMSSKLAPNCLAASADAQKGFFNNGNTDLI